MPSVRSTFGEKSRRQESLVRNVSGEKSVGEMQLGTLEAYIALVHIVYPGFDTEGIERVMLWAVARRALTK
ncbi:hypothetical protein VE01_02962 [Pseudogymnoascus verrucosus]|uniref:Uncharacterized protein n=1 Tax=Pseudogymnoascus verrucosus TaxID=342668 RepID=A0A1B8GUD1_9PEZI|nr:uncharacterized protein VE01_02962 [Pseudogymnoascus verrucosus]OBT99435.1 hypothetical protein VE01_02962 [Pseudogymnoascus verrucosus]